MHMPLLPHHHLITLVTPIQALTTSPTTIPYQRRYRQPDQQTQELLWSILTTFSRIHGSQSHLFPRLLEQCRSVLQLDGSITLSNSLPILGSGAADIIGVVTHSGAGLGTGPVRGSRKHATTGHGDSWL